MENQYLNTPDSAIEKTSSHRFFRFFDIFGLIFGGVLGGASALILVAIPGGFGLYFSTPLLYALNPWLMALSLLAKYIGISGFGGISTPYRLLTTILGTSHFGPLDAIGNPVLFVVINLLFWSAISSIYKRSHFILRIFIILVLSALVLYTISLSLMFLRR